MKYAEKIRTLKDNGALRRLESNLLKDAKDARRKADRFKGGDREISFEINRLLLWDTTKEGYSYWRALFGHLGGKF